MYGKYLLGFELKTENRFKIAASLLHVVYNISYEM